MSRAQNSAPLSDIELLAHRIRSDIDAPLNSDIGWSQSNNGKSALFYDQPFRIRFQTRASSPSPDGHTLSLQYRKDGAMWKPIGVSDFPYPKFAAPPVSIVSTKAYQHGNETERLLGDPQIDWDNGIAINLSASTPVFRSSMSAREWEWPLVVRRFADGPEFNENDATFEFRLVDSYGLPLSGMPPVIATFTATPGHLGGTFVETPERIGPYQNEVGHLYFFMEPTETDNKLMAVKSEDYGATWREVSGQNRPLAVDLEGLASARIGNSIHLLHQVNREVFHHVFQMGELDTWIVDSSSIATPAEPPTQYAALTARENGSLVAVYAGEHKLFMQIRSESGIWSEGLEIDAAESPDLSGPVVQSLADDRVVLAYKGLDGRGFVRYILPDNTLSPRQLISEKMGIREEENGSVLPIVALGNQAVIVYRERDGLLYERRLSDAGKLGEPSLISEVSVVSGAVDSDQVGADLVAHNGTLHLLFIDDESRSINYSKSSQSGEWSTPERIVSGVNASWVRGSVHYNADQQTHYGFVYDAGSQGGAGMNRYVSIPITE